MTITSMRTLAAAFMLCSFLAVHSTAGPVSLTQGGWSYGGPLTVSFTGEDNNSDGQIDGLELSDFAATYALPQGGSTTWVLGDLQPGGFLFASAADYLFFATNPDYSLVDSAFQGLVTGSIVDSFLFPIDITDEAPVVVPEPAGMVGLGLLTVALWRRRRTPLRQR